MENKFCDEHTQMVQDVASIKSTMADVQEKVSTMCGDIKEALYSRPKWSVALTITILSNIIVALIAYLVGHN